MGWEHSAVVRFDLGPLLQGETRIAKPKSAYNWLIIGPRGLQCETSLYEIMGWEFLMWLHLTLDPSFKVKRGQPNLKVLITRLLLILEVCNVKPTYRISWAGNLLMLLELTFGPSFKVQR